MFTPMSETRRGDVWIATAWIVQDLEIDPEGRYIYAEGQVEISKTDDDKRPRQLKHLYGHNVWTWNTTPTEPKVFTLSNRGWSVVNGRIKWSPPFYKLEDANKCLTSLLNRLVILGSQSS